MQKETRVPVLKIETNTNVYDGLSIEAHGTPNQMLGFIARHRIELDLLEASIKTQLADKDSQRQD